MIKNILAYIGVIVLVVIGYVCVFRGAELGEFNILSYEDVIKKQELHEQKIIDYTTLVNTTYENSLANLETAKENYEKNKASYEELKQYTSYQDLLELTRVKQYSIELIWIKLDLIARHNNLDAKYNLVNSETGESKNLEIRLFGDYLAIKDFIYDMLIDLDLQFKADNVTITPNGSSVEANLVVKDINVVM